MVERLGDKPIEPQYIEMMNKIAKGLDRIFNGDKKGADRPTGFVLLVFPFDKEGHAPSDGRCNFISNGADRKDIVVLFKEMISRFEGQPEAKGRA
jgi:hypothetical protein